MNRTIQDNFRRVHTDYQLNCLRVEHVRPIVAAVAFAMMFWKEQPVVEVPSIATDKARDFFEFMEHAGFVTVLKKERIQFEVELLELVQVDTESVQFHFYSESPAREAPSEIRDIRMSDATVRDFFAAHWAARYLSLQLDWLESQTKVDGSSAIDLESRLRANVNSADLRKFWQLLVGMPGDTPVTHEEAATEASWTDAVAPLFEVCESRPTELMYRCWPDLLWRAGFMEYRDHVDGPNWNETPMADGTLKAQREVRRRFENGESDFSASPARCLVSRFLTHYLEQCRSQEVACMSDPNVTGEMKLRFYLACDFQPIDVKSFWLQPNEYIAEREERLAYLNEHYPLWLFERSFRVIEGGPFLYGDDPDPTNPAYLRSFEINAYLVTMSMWEHFSKNENTLHEMQSIRGLSWYDSLVFAMWCHGRLADEHQWEAAARGNVGNLDQSRHFVFGNNGDSLFENYLSLPPYWNRVGVRLPSTTAELYDMHGMRGQWCADLFVQHKEERVIRGQSYWPYVFISECSLRAHARPSDILDQGRGCRVSRARDP